METFSYIFFHIFTFQLSNVKIECFCLPKQQEVTLNKINPLQIFEINTISHEFLGIIDTHFFNKYFQ
jgi:hypothetical protein